MIQWIATLPYCRPAFYGEGYPTKARTKSSTEHCVPHGCDSLSSRRLVKEDAIPIYSLPANTSRINSCFMRFCNQGFEPTTNSATTSQQEGSRTSRNHLLKKKKRTCRKSIANLHLPQQTLGSPKSKPPQVTQDSSQ